ncbi:phage integrase family protein [Burkholderia sp. L27(2015)]|uniref:phage integrase family protein n=1 Tax=Burkholderia sp. L27(2015) TaxID=1641858 RepID=UPI00131D4A19|nr:phage integrase family protein [Burkholderia sp. L27(2015)]
MKTRRTSALPSPDPEPAGFPDHAALAALRAWYAGLSTRQAVERYLNDRLEPGVSARAIIGRIRNTLIDLARARQRPDLVSVLQHDAAGRVPRAKAAGQAIELLRSLPATEPHISDDIALWFAERAVRALRAHGINTLADLTVRIPRRRRWWAAVPGLGQASARHIESFFAEHPQLTERARALVVASDQGGIVPWEQLRLPHEVDGSHGTFRAPQHTCMLTASNDYAAIKAWLSLHEAASTQRAYRKEAERLILWAIVERNCALSSLTTEDAIAYRSFLRRPTPQGRWVGPPRPRTAPDWRPFSGGLAARSIAYSLTVLAALFRWLIAQRYLLANPFAGIKVRGSNKAELLDTSHAFSDGEWALVRAIAEGLEWSYDWQPPAARRLRFVLDFAYATGLRASELVGAKLGSVRGDPQGDHWLHVVGKGSKAAKVAMPPLARGALDRYLAERGLPIAPSSWDPKTPLVGSLESEIASGITSARLWAIMRRFFRAAADIIQDEHPVLAEKLRRASPHWMRHTHATHALASGAELTTVRDNLRHASIATTSIYLHGDEAKRARQLNDAFSA